ncbi:MAG: hypothetical protein Q7S78_00760 [Candidatus Azambacteria bacterium]|nr:hypothetical protein [Candidatus Azambacteria bacterium]
MKIKDVEFPRVVFASGAYNFFGPGNGIGHGWWYDKYLDRFLPWLSSSEKAGFIAKTTPFFYRQGNMRLGSDLQPIEKFPDCVKFYFLRGIALNSVGLSSPGAIELFELNKWQKIDRPFGLSHMSVKPTLKQRITETTGFARLLKKHLPNFLAAVWLEENLSCPNTGHDVCSLSDERLYHLEAIANQNLGIPVFAKLSPEDSVSEMLRIAHSGLCDGISYANTLKFGRLPEEIPWKKLFGTDDPEKSPLAKYGGGGLSGWILGDLICRRIEGFRQEEPNFPIMAGGGINCHWNWFSTKKLIDRLVDKGRVSVIVIGTGKVMRPFYLRPTIWYADKKLKEAER